MGKYSVNKKKNFDEFYLNVKLPMNYFTSNNDD